MDDLKFTTAENYIMDQQYEHIKECLHEGVVEINFTKANGEQRVMLATLHEGLIPVDLQPKGNDRKKSDEAQAVYDVEADGWRSFRWDSIISWDVA